MAASVLIVDDHAGFRAQARRLLEREGFHVVGEAADCRTALLQARVLVPDVALVDVHLREGEGDGFALTSQLRALDEPPAVILISSHDGAEFARCIAASGARGFVPKEDLCRQAIEEMLS